METAHTSCASQRGGEAINVGETERLVSSIVGGCAVLFGLSRLSLTSLVALAAGGALLARGITGHCAMYDTLGMSTANGESTAGVRASHSHPVTDASLAATGEVPPF